jgi:cytochrome c-type biogenesis protein CcmH/NrfG
MRGGKMVKQEFMIMVALITLVVGFVIGVVFSSSQSTQVTRTVAQQPSQQAPGLAPDQAVSILNLEKEVAANPENIQAWTSLGNIYFDTGNAPKAINSYNKALALDPSSPNVWTDLGVMYRRNKQPFEAIKAFERATSLNPTHEQARFNTGIVLMYDLNDKAGAKKAWEELLTINPVAMAPNGQSVKEMIDSL